MPALLVVWQRLAQVSVLLKPQPYAELEGTPSNSAILSQTLLSASCSEALTDKHVANSKIRFYCMAVETILSLMAHAFPSRAPRNLFYSKTTSAKGKDLLGILNLHNPVGPDMLHFPIACLFPNMPVYSNYGCWEGLVKGTFHWPPPAFPVSYVFGQPPGKIQMSCS